MIAMYECANACLVVEILGENDKITTIKIDCPQCDIVEQKNTISYETSSSHGCGIILFEPIVIKLILFDSASNFWFFGNRHCRTAFSGDVEGFAHDVNYGS